MKVVLTERGIGTGRSPFLPFLLGCAVLFCALDTGAVEVSDHADDSAEVVLGEEDLADRAEILRNRYRRMTPGDVPLVQDVGVWPAAWEEFSPVWNGAAAERELGTWMVPVAAEKDGTATVLRDGDGVELWRGQTDFSKDGTESVVLTGALVAEDDWALYRAARDEIDRRAAASKWGDGGGMRGTNGPCTNGLHFVLAEGNFATNPPELRVGIVWTNSAMVDVFAYGPLHVAETNVVTYTNDENAVVTATNVTWHSVEPTFSGFDNAWEWIGTVSVSNAGTNVFVDNSFPADCGIVRYYAAAEAVDSDGDGLNDGFEMFVSHSDTDSSDGDGDGISDWDEFFTCHTDPSLVDSDHDGLDDPTEIYMGLNPTNPDTDNDGLHDGDEISHGTYPLIPDSDNDGLPDGWEVDNGLNPMSSTGDDGADGDPDSDGFPNLLEFELDARANNPAWNGHQLAYRLRHLQNGDNQPGLHVDVLDAWNCGGSSHTQQIATDGLCIPDLMASGYYIDLTIEGRVEDQNAGYDMVSFDAATNTFFFEGNENHHGCDMVTKQVTKQVLILTNSQVTLCYDTGGSMYHTDAYAEVVDAVLVAPYSVEVEGPDCLRVGDEAQLTALGGSGAPYAWGTLDPAINIDTNTGTITAVTTGVAYVVAMDSSGQCYGEKKIVVFDIGLDVENTSLTLKHDHECDLEVQVRPEGEVPVQQYRIEINAANATIWYRLSKTRTLEPWRAKVAGEFELRGAAQINNRWYYSSNVIVQVQFPTYDQIVSDSVVQAMVSSEWSSTLADCTENPNRRREHGFWVLLRTRDNSYLSGGNEVGPWAGPNDDATIELSSQPADFPQNPVPNASGALYAVAAFHSHTPVTYRTNYPAGYGLEVGPSTNDNNANLADGVVGIVCDYVEFPAGSGSIPPGHPKNAPFMLYQSGLSRRELP